MLPARIMPLVLAIALVVPSLTSAHEGATGMVKERMDAMTSMSKTMKIIGRFIEANRNLAGIQEEAGRIREIAARMPQWFPPGSDTKPTDALPAIWQRWSDFQARAAQLEQEIAKLAAMAASGDPRGTAAQFQAVGKACSGCHADYRQKP